MVRLEQNGIFLKNGKDILPSQGAPFDREQARRETMAYSILTAHNTSGDDKKLRIKFDAMASHDITYVGIVQTARASGLDSFPLPYVLTNCHNSLCAVGGTINEDDHVFGLSAAKKYGGIYVPAHQAVIHMYMRECMSGVGKMILGSDSHTRYGALGTMAIGEGGPELVKQLLNKTYDINMPQVVAVYLEGSPRKGVGPQDVALAIIGAVFGSGLVKNKVLEFVGPGITSLPIEFRNGIDVMTTETTCLSSIWVTDETVEDYYKTHGRPEAYKKLAPGDVAYYDSLVRVDLSKVECMIALPFHPSNVYTVKQLTENAGDILRGVEKTAARQLGIPDGKYRLTDKVKDGRLVVDQGVIAGCAGGTFDNICAAADILDGGSVGSDYFSLSVYPASQPVALDLTKNGTIDSLMTAGATIRSAFCGPCFGAGDVPNNGALSIRHTTRNFPSREGSKPGSGQIASVALMDARSIAATAANKGVLTAATELDVEYKDRRFEFDGRVYQNRVYNGYGKPQKDAELRFGPNIADWPRMGRLTDNLILRVASVITDPVTTTDELIPSGETSSYRSNPLKLAQFTLSRKDPEYVGRAQYVGAAEAVRLEGGSPAGKVPELEGIYGKLSAVPGLGGVSPSDIGIGTTIYAHRPGDGSAREQAASCQKVLGGWANIAIEYATKRYRSNLINWGMLPLLIKEGVLPFALGDFILLTGLKTTVGQRGGEITAYNLSGDKPVSFTLTLSELTEDESRIILSGCLINYYNE